jgi:hypothetical protein
MMKRSSAAVFPIFFLLISFGCSSTPSGTIAISDLQKNATKYLGQKVVVVGTADIKTELAPKMLKLYNKFDFVYVSRPESSYYPDQGRPIRVTGTLRHERINLIGEVNFIDATKVEVE